MFHFLFFYFFGFPHKSLWFPCRGSVYDMDKNKRKHQRSHCNLHKQEELVEHFAQLANRLAGTSSTLLITDHILMDVITQITEVDTDREKREEGKSKTESLSLIYQTNIPPCSFSLSFPLFIFLTHRWVQEESGVRRHFWKIPMRFCITDCQLKEHQMKYNFSRSLTRSLTHSLTHTFIRTPSTVTPCHVLKYCLNRPPLNTHRCTHLSNYQLLLQDYFYHLQLSQ